MTQRALRQIAQVLTGVAQVTSLLTPSNTTTTTTTTTTPEFEFTALPDELQHYILGLLTINSQATTLKEAVVTINALYLVNHQLNQMIDANFIPILMHLINKFEAEPMKVASMLNTAAARQYMEDMFADPMQYDANYRR
jgi:hypothetical protein